MIPISIVKTPRKTYMQASMVFLSWKRNKNKHDPLVQYTGHF